MKQALITISGENKKKSVQVILEGDLVLGSLHKIKEELTVAINQYNTIHITLKNVSGIDLTGIQLLFVIKKTLEALHKKFSFDIQLTDELNVVVTQAGFAALPDMLHTGQVIPVKKIITV